MRILMASLLALASLTAGAQDTKLTDDQVDRFVDALEELVERQDELGDPSGKQSQQQMLAMAREYQSLISDHGFTTREWADVARRVMSAYAALEMEDQQASMKLDQARERIRNNPDLSEQAKQRMLKQMDQQEAMMKDMGSPADQEVVAPYADEIGNLVE